MVSIDQEALTAFIQKMTAVTDAIESSRNSGSMPYAGTLSGGSGPEKWADGVQVTLGTTEYDHAGRQAGLDMAALIGASMEAIVSVEEGARAMAELATNIQNSLNEQDQINYDELVTILGDADMRPYEANELEGEGDS
ncbi:MAG TPA: hypothetical protein H9881_18015 [Candidatus Stackebrandtia excrementipullorum]|nr:hypothetical protein [Candidatus Stackebrandtia excrementipullorum]